MNIEIWDASMGSGKTTGIIDWAKDNPWQKYLYITPFVTEADTRIVREGGDTLNFVAPDDKLVTKSEDLLYLLQKGRNISTTHSLYKIMTERHYDLLQDYVVIMDELVDFMESYDCNEDDFGNICGDFVDIDYSKFGQVIPLKKLRSEGSGNIAGIVKDAEKGIIYASNNSTKVFVTQLPLKLLTSAQRTIILTYRFQGSTLAAFLGLHGIYPTPFTEGKLQNSEEEIKEHIRNYLILPSLKSVDALPDARGYLNYTWHRTAAPKEFVPLRAAYRGIFRKHPKNQILFTCSKKNVYPVYKGVANPRYVGDGQYFIPKVDQKEILKNNFLACNSRATNNYQSKRVMVHGFDREPNGDVRTYLGSYGSTLDRNEYALSEMVQWFWRGSIRNLKDKNPMYAYILSSRMKGLFIDWLAE